MKLRIATRSQVKLRIWLSSPSGWGKTYSALRLGHWICKDWSKIALIDTENWSWELYSSLWGYQVLTLKAPFSPEKYIEAIETCEKEGMEVIIIDSISHEWEWEWGCLQINDRIANTKFKWNTWAAWSQTTPRHQAFIQKIIQADAHIITTVRNKVESAQINWKIKKVWTKELTREGFEYELTVNFNIERDSHDVTASKDRTGLFIDRDPFLITEKTWEEIIKWNNSGVAVVVELTHEEEQEELFNQTYESIKMCANKNAMDLYFSNLKEEIKEDPNMLTRDHLKKLGILKKDMIKSFESKAEKTENKK